MFASWIKAALDRLGRWAASRSVRPRDYVSSQAALSLTADEATGVYPDVHQNKSDS